MNEIEKIFLKRKNRQVKAIIFLTIILVVFNLVISSTVSGINFQENNLDNQMKMNVKEEIDINKPSTGLPPSTLHKSPSIKSNIDNELQTLGITLYGYCVTPSSAPLVPGPVYFQDTSPGTITQISATSSCNFISGGTWIPPGCSESRWYGVQYGNGLLYTIDKVTGDMVCLGGGGASLNGLAYNDFSETLYTCDCTSLYTVEKCHGTYTGRLTYVGDFGITGCMMIGMAYSPINNKLYGVDIVTNSLYTISNSGAATLVAPLIDTGGNPIDLNYAQDMAFDKKTNTLYLAAYTMGLTSSLLTCNLITTPGQCTNLGQFQGNAEIAGLAIPYCECDCTDLYVEDFSTWPPAGWTTDWWTQSFTNNAGGTPPAEAMVYKYDQYHGGQYFDNYIMSEVYPVSGCEIIILEFKFSADLYYPQCAPFYVKWKGDSGIWVDATPWRNPLMYNIQGTYRISINCGPGGCGSTLQVKWEYLGYYGYYNYFYLDDVKIICCNSLNSPPSAPTISGPTQGTVLHSYDFDFQSTSPTGNPISYYVDWGDFTDTKSTFNPNGATCTLPHGWLFESTYYIKAKAIDICGAESDWAFHTIIIPKSKAVYDHPFQQLWEIILNHFQN